MMKAGTRYFLHKHSWRMNREELTENTCMHRCKGWAYTGHVCSSAVRRLSHHQRSEVLGKRRSIRIIKDKVFMGVRLNGVLFVKATPTTAEDKVSNQQTGLTNVSRLWSVGPCRCSNASPRERQGSRDALSHLSTNISDSLTVSEAVFERKPMLATL